MAELMGLEKFKSQKLDICCFSDQIFYMIITQHGILHLKIINKEMVVYKSARAQNFIIIFPRIAFSASQNLSIV